MRRVVASLLVAVASGCSLLTQFDPESQPCDAVGECRPGFACIEGLCRGVDGGAEVCSPACASGEACVRNRCYPTRCGAVECGEGAVCDGAGGCLLAACADVTCDPDRLCVVGTCEPSACGSATCRAGQACRGGACVDVGCTGVTCAAGLQCRQGACVGCSASEANCTDGQDDDCDGKTDCADEQCAGQACDDGNVCTIGERCGNGACMQGTPKVCNQPPSPCQAAVGSCEPVTGACRYPNVADATSCGSTGNQRCCNGLCVNLSSSTGNCGGCGTTCNTGFQCLPLEASGCTGEPVNLSGRCGCSTSNDCPRGQICTMSRCAPVDLMQCAPNQTVPPATLCSRYCRY